MNQNNKKTLESYNTHIQEYIDGTPNEVTGAVKDWLDLSLSSLSNEARILEVGSAFGRDAEYIKKSGYDIKCTDATPAFVDLLNSKGFEASILNLITDDLPGNLDLIIANAVLLHFTRDEAEAAIGKVFESLNKSGRFAFTLKRGEGEKWSSGKLGAPRYFCYWTEDQIRRVLESTGFTDIRIDTYGRELAADWLQIIANK